MPGPFRNQNPFSPGPQQLESSPTLFTPFPEPVNYENGLWLQLVRRPYRAAAISYGYVVPAVVGPGIVFSPVRVRSAQTPRRYYRSRSFVNPPSVVAPAPPPPVQTVTRVTLAPSSRLGRRPSYRLSPPTRVGPGIVFRPIDVTNVVTPRRQRRTVHRIGEPQILGAALPAPAPLIPLVDVHLAAQPRQTYHVGRYGVAPPTIVGIYPTPDQLVVRVDLTQSPKQERSTHYFLRKPQALISPTPNRPQTVLSVNLALSDRQARRTHSKLSLPVVVIGVRPTRSQVTIKVGLTAPTKIPYHAQSSKLYPPQVLGPFVPPPPPPPPPAVPTGWSPFIDGPEQRHSYTAPELWYGDKPPPPRRKR